MNVSVRGYWGSFNFCNPSEKTYQLCLSTPYGNVSEHFNHEVEPESIGEALDAIEARVKEYWINSRRDETLAKCAAIREHLNECEQAYIQGQITAFEKKLERDQRTLTAMKSVLEELQEQAAADALKNKGA